MESKNLAYPTLKLSILFIGFGIFIVLGNLAYALDGNLLMWSSVRSAYTEMAFSVLYGIIGIGVFLLSNKKLWTLLALFPVLLLHHFILFCFEHLSTSISGDWIWLYFLAPVSGVILFCYVESHRGDECDEENPSSSRFLLFYLLGSGIVLAVSVIMLAKGGYLELSKSTILGNIAKLLSSCFVIMAVYFSIVSAKNIRERLIDIGIGAKIWLGLTILVYLYFIIYAYFTAYSPDWNILIFSFASIIGTILLIANKRIGWSILTMATIPMIITQLRILSNMWIFSGEFTLTGITDLTIYETIVLTVQFFITGCIVGNKNFIIAVLKLFGLLILWFGWFGCFTYIVVTHKDNVNDFPDYQEKLFLDAKKKINEDVMYRFTDVNSITHNIEGKIISIEEKAGVSFTADELVSVVSSESFFVDFSYFPKHYDVKVELTDHGRLNLFWEKDKAKTIQFEGVPYYSSLKNGTLFFDGMIITNLNMHTSSTDTTLYTDLRLNHYLNYDRDAAWFFLIIISLVFLFRGMSDTIRPRSPFSRT
jgi:hypothetical protein